MKVGGEIEVVLLCFLLPPYVPTSENNIGLLKTYDGLRQG